MICLRFKYSARSFLGDTKKEEEITLHKAIFCISVSVRKGYKSHDLLPLFQDLLSVLCFQCLKSLLHLLRSNDFSLLKKNYKMHRFLQPTYIFTYLQSHTCSKIYQGRAYFLGCHITRKVSTVSFITCYYWIMVNIG